MDIRKLQSAIVNGLEDVKAQDILVFDTEHLSPLFERVIIASGSSNRQAKALAASVRDAVRAAGFQVLRTEGQDNGEWIIVDCAAAVVHIMQPVIRQYYHLEDIWGEKPVVMQAKARKGLVKASEEDQDAEAPVKKASGKKTSIAASPAKKAGAKKVAAKKAVAKKAAGKSVVAKKAPAKKVAAKKVVAKKSASHVTKIVVNAPKPAARKAAVKKAVGKKVASKKVAVKKVAAKKVVAKKAPSRSGNKG